MRTILAAQRYAGNMFLFAVDKEIFQCYFAKSGADRSNNRTDDDDICYYEMLHWMTEDAGWQFAERMAVDFHRSMELDELDQELFSQEEKTGLYVLAKDPGFLKRYYLGKVVYSKKIFDLNNELGRRAEELDASHRENDELRREMEAQRINYETSTTFRVGKAVMFVPVTLKKAVKKLLHRN